MFDRLAFRQKLLAIIGLFFLACLLVYSAALKNTFELVAANEQLESQIGNLQRSAQMNAGRQEQSPVKWAVSNSMEDAQSHFFETFDRFIDKGGKMDLMAMPMAQKIENENGLQSFVLTVEVESSFNEALRFMDHCDSKLEVLKLHSVNLQRISDRQTKQSKLITKLTFSGVLSTNQA